MQSSLPRYIILIFVIAVFIYDQVAYYYFPINEFAYYAVIPTMIILITAYFVYKKIYRR
jgi:uncharacterized membrane protein YcaP (DUF421 family)